MTRRRGSKRPQILALILAVAGGAGAWLLATDGEPAPQAPPPASKAAEPAPERLRVEVVATYPHDPGAFTQGLLWHGGALYESTGQYGRSELRQVELASGRVLRRAPLADDMFGEGLALAGDRLFQLTWENGLALVWDLATFEERARLPYDGEGWGLCFDGEKLYLSNGGFHLSVRHPETFAELRRLPVRLPDGRPVTRLNELECPPGGAIYANLWGADDIVRIDPASGRVTAVIDAFGLLTPQERLRSDVLNGIAHRPETGTFLLTGKLWPKVFEARFE